MSHTPLAPVLLSKLADRAASRFCRQHAGPLLEEDDVRQDLLLDVLTRIGSFDPARSSFPTFATICFQHRTARLGVAVDRGQLARHPAALDAPLANGDGTTLLDTIATDEGYGAWVGQPTDPVAEAEQRHDLDRALSAMPADVVPLCALLLVGGNSRAGRSRTTLHRRIHDLRCRLLAAGVGGGRGTFRRVAE